MPGEELRALMSRVPSGVAVVTVDANGQRLGLTVSSLVALSLEPPLVAIALSRQAAMHELLREADGFAVSILSEGQERLAQHFSRGVPPIAMWDGIAVEAGASGAPLLTGALGWLECRLHDELQVGTHTLFVGDVVRVQFGKDAPPLQRSYGEYTSGDRSPSSSASTDRLSTSDSALSTTMANAQEQSLSPSELHRKRSPTAETKMTRPSDTQEEHRKTALTAFLAARVSEGYRIETRTDTHAIIAPAKRSVSIRDRLRGVKPPERQVISVDEDGNVTMRPAEPLRS